MIGVIAIGGQPAAGKSKIVEALLQRIGSNPVAFTYGLVNGILYGQKQQLAVIGRYGEHRMFPGTDGLSMQAQPHFDALLSEWADLIGLHGRIVLFEGDRLFNRITLSRVIQLQLPHFFYLVETTPELLQQRHISRVDTQSTAWLKGRATKIINLREEFTPTTLINNNVVDLLSNVTTLMSAIAELQTALELQTTLIPDKETQP